METIIERLRRTKRKLTHKHYIEMQQIKTPEDIKQAMQEIGIEVY